MSINYKQVGKRVKNLRLKLGYTQAELAEMCNISNVYVSHIENGSAKVSLEVLYKICINLNITPDFLLMDSLYISQEYIKDEIALLLKKCDAKQLQLVQRLIKAVLE